MKNFKKPQFAIIALAVFFIVLFLLLPRVEKPGKEIANIEEVSESVTDLVSGLSAADKEIFDAINDNISSVDDPLEKIDWYDSLSGFWELQGSLFKSAEALSEIAEIIKDKPSYFIAGDKFFEAYQNDPAEYKRLAIQKSIDNYQKILDENPEDLEAMTSLGVCYVEGAQTMGEAPMKGIGILKEVLVKDPENINALINLGYFATKSGQYDIAEQRFIRVLEIDDSYADAYIYLSDLYLKMDKRDKAVEQLELYKAFIKDPEIVKQLDEYIEKIIKNNI